jgi:hypothetical protein
MNTEIRTLPSGGLRAGALAEALALSCRAPARAVPLRPPNLPLFGPIGGGTHPRHLLAGLAELGAGRPIRSIGPLGTLLITANAADGAELADASLRAHVPARIEIPGRPWRWRQGAPCPDGGTRPVPEPAKLAEAVARQIDLLLGQRRHDDCLAWIDWRHGIRHALRDVVLGEAAAGDTLLGDMVDALSGRVSEPARTSCRAVPAVEQARSRRLAPYLDAPRPGTFAAGLADAGYEREAAERMIIHALAVGQRALAAVVLRAVTALCVLGPGAADPAAAVAETLRLWPPVSVARYTARADFTWRDEKVSAGTRILLPLRWYLRDPRTFALPDGFLPHLSDRAQSRAVDPAPFCCSARPCAADDLVTSVAVALVRELRAVVEPRAAGPLPDLSNQDPMFDPLPEPSRVRIAFADREEGPRHGHSVVDRTGAAHELVETGAPLARYAELAQGSARALREHAVLLRECSQSPAFEGYGRDPERERLWVHAGRCLEAAEDVRNATERLLAAASDDRTTPVAASNSGA